MELAAIHSPGAAFVAGLVTSLHCAGMCGPLSCGLMPVKGDRADPGTVRTVYHASRLASYTLLGVAAGALGSAPLALLSSTTLRWLPWLLVVFFIGLAFQWDRHLPKLPFLGGGLWGLWARLRGQSRVTAAGVLGFATPLLPCGPLYFLVTLAMLAGSALHGAETMLAFGLGTVPLLWVAQSQFQWVRQKLSPLWRARLRVGLSLVAAGVIGWRLRSTIGFSGPDWWSFGCFTS